MTLSIEDFPRFFRELWKHDPFPWQERLVRQVHREGRWPNALDLPTGTGKTSALDVAVFTLALEDPNTRRLPLRTILIVDRRTIVDQTTERARTITERLRVAETPVLRAVATALGRLAGEGAPAPLVSTTLRGAMPRDDSWARTPTQPLLVASTVDQVGSRLLFRGYGIGPRSRAIHAGLLGNDALLFLDEVHLSRPFQQTLEAVQRYRQYTTAQLSGDRWQVVELSATRRVKEDESPAFTLAEEDRKHPVLSGRLSASKPVTLETVKTSGSEAKRMEAVGKAIVRQVLDALREDPGAVVGVIQNRVAGALGTWRMLRERLDETELPALLLTGRMRPLDREDLEAQLGSLAGPGRDRGNDKGGVVVATQCVEAGADLDFDLLISEAASFDALVQRMGRLNRTGQCGRPRGIVMIRDDQVAPKDPDPVYGEALANTWRFLESQETLNFGLDWLPRPKNTELPSLLPPVMDAPVLLPAHLDAWVQTHPDPYPDPDVELFLHGPERGAPEVSLVWRADLTYQLLAADPDAALARVEAAPPATVEAVTLPLYAVQRWLHGLTNQNLADVDGAKVEHSHIEEAPDAPVAVWRSGRRSDVVQPGDLKPGDVVVVPAAYGGLEGGTFTPDAGRFGIKQGEDDGRIFPSDLGDRAQLLQRGRPTLRLNIDTLRSVAPREPWPEVPGAHTDEDVDPEESDADRVLRWLNEAAELSLPAWAIETINNLKTRRNLRLVTTPSSNGQLHIVATARRRVRWDRTAEVSTEDDRASFTGVEVTLGAHLDGVAAFAEQFATRLQLPTEMIEALVAAARFHDIGKADARFQAILQGGDRLRVDAAHDLLAKSSHRRAVSRVERAEIRRLAEYPDGWRHELLSVAMLSDPKHADRLGDLRELVLHLVGSHHGWCRPLAPVVIDEVDEPVRVEHDGWGFVASPNHGLARLDSGVADRFWRLNETYGWWGLAWLEAIIRLADQSRSEWEQKEVGTE